EGVQISSSYPVPVTVRPPSDASVQAPAHNSERPRGFRHRRLSLRGLRSQHVRRMSVWRSGLKLVEESRSRRASLRGAYRDTHGDTHRGELLVEMKERKERAKSGDGDGAGHGNTRRPCLPTLAELGVSKSQSSL